MVRLIIIVILTLPRTKGPETVDFHPMAEEPNDKADWDELLVEIGLSMEVLFILNNRRDKEVWQYIVGAAAQLEYLAVAILWVVAGKPGPFDDYEDRITLGRAILKIERKDLLPPDIIDTIRAINKLRNSVAHRGAVSGVTLPGELQRGFYKERHVFRNLDALRQLVADHKRAVKALSKCRHS